MHGWDGGHRRIAARITWARCGTNPAAYPPAGGVPANGGGAPWVGTHKAPNTVDRRYRQGRTRWPEALAPHPHRASPQPSSDLVLEDDLQRRYGRAGTPL